MESFLLACAGRRLQLMRNPLGRQRPVYLFRLLLLPLAFGCAAKRWPRYQSTLTPVRCDTTRNADTTALVRVLVTPKDARTSTLSLMLSVVRQDGSDSVVAHPAYGVDTIPNVHPGLYRLSVHAIGYRPPRDTIRVGPGEAWCVAARMVRAADMKAVF